MKGTNLNPALITRLKENTVGPQGLHHLDLTNCNAGSKELSALAEAIKSNIQSSEGIAPLISIDISGNQLCGIDSMMSGIYDSDGLSDFSNVMIIMAKMSRLRKINISRNYLDTKGFAIIANILVNGPSSLTDLNLRNCGGNAKAIEKLMEALKSNKTLINLDLNQNDIGTEGAEYLADALSVNKKLKQLNISECNIGSDGSISIFKNLTNNNTIEILNISDNNIGDSGSEAIGNFLKSNVTLKHLDVQENRITTEGVSLISKGLTKNKTLIFLGFRTV
jgi:Ran GTPase-activating protein (RanGAP) involved in mRNA processing and transport